MSKELVAKEQRALEVSISRDLVSQAMGIENLDKVSIDDLVDGYKRTDNFEKMAIARIKEGADHDRGMYIEGIKAKDPKGWATIVEKKLAVKRGHANKLAKYFRDSHSFTFAISPISL